MKTKRTFPLLMLGLLLAGACNKDSPSIPAFSPAGYWQGAFFQGATITVLNRADGSSRLYLLVGGVDTSTQALKLDGTYSISEGQFQANYIDTAGTTIANVESFRTTDRSMEGLVFLNGSTLTQTNIQTYNFQLVKH